MSSEKMMEGGSEAEPSPLLSLREKASLLPMHPGVYRFVDAKGVVLYVGKANRLRERVRSYFASDIAETRNPGIETMVREAVDIEYDLAGSEPEALLLEARQIRRFKPKYNILLRDDKSFVLITIDTTKLFPVVGMSRERDLEKVLEKKKREALSTERVQRKLDGIEYYGPFPSTYAVKSVLTTIRRIWPFRDCGDQKFSQFSALGHGCIFASMGLCDAPCAAKVSEEDYLTRISEIRAFLRGDQERLVTSLRVQMDAAAENEAYELAAILRNRLFDLKRFQYMVDTFRSRKRSIEEQSAYNAETDLRIECYDISNNQGAFAVGSLVSAVLYGAKRDPLLSVSAVKERFALEKGRYRKFKIRTVVGISDVEMLREVLDRRLRRASSWGLPDVIMIDGGKAQLAAARAVVDTFERAKAQVRVVSVAKGPTRKRTDLYGEGWNDFAEIDRECWHRVAELLREEAHRFAIGYYRQLHRAALLNS